ncbi:MAG: hypothetical protein O3A96_13615 [Proteobacteria bacterium]|nr:hypothetical protein [Pseudomonadota bacterium]
MKIAACHTLLAERLNALGEAADAAVMADFTPPPGAETVLCDDEICHAEHPIGLLFAGLKPLEMLSQNLEEVLLTVPDDETRAEAERILDCVVARIAQIGQRIELRDGP